MGRPVGSGRRSAEVNTYGSDLAIALKTVEEAMDMDGVKVPTSIDDHHYICRKNRHTTSKVYTIRRTCLVTLDGLLKTAMEPWPADHFKLADPKLNSCAAHRL